MPYGDGWLVKGVDDDDEIVVHGAGVLWSLEGMGAHPVGDDDETTRTPRCWPPSYAPPWRIPAS